MKGGLDGVGKQLLNQAGEHFMGAAKEYLGSIVNEMFVKKESNVKRFLPSIKNMKIVSFHLDPSTTTEPSRWQLALCFTKRP